MALRTNPPPAVVSSPSFQTNGKFDYAKYQQALTDPSRVDEWIGKLPPALGKLAWSSTHTTFSPNVCRGGLKTNVIPDVVDIEVDIRTIPGDDEEEVRRHLDKALSDLSEQSPYLLLFYLFDWSST